MRKNPRVEARLAARMAPVTVRQDYLRAMRRTPEGSEPPPPSQPRPVMSFCRPKALITRREHSDLTTAEKLRDCVRHRTKAGGFGTPTEFLRHLIRKDQDERARRELEARLLEGLKSPRSRVAPKTYFKRMHALIDEVAKDKRKKGRN